MNKVFIVLSIVISVVLFIYTLLVYLGLIRYMKLYTQPTHIFAEKYKLLDKASNKKVLISMSISEEYLPKLKCILHSLLDQSVKVDNIALNVPSHINIPSELSKYMSVYKTKDYGSGNKIVPTIEREKFSDTLILILDANKIYGENFVSDMVDAFEQNSIVYSNKTNDSYSGPLLVQSGYFDSNFIKFHDNVDKSLFSLLSSKIQKLAHKTDYDFSIL